MTKSELIEHLASHAGLTKGHAESVVNAIFDSMLEALSRGEGIEIRGFGSFTVRQYKSYPGRNPRTGETVHVAPKRLPYFKVGKELRERVNGEVQASAPTQPKSTPTSSGSAPRPVRAPKAPRSRDDGLSEDVI